MIVFLVISLTVIILCICFSVHGDLLAPAFVFCGSFLFSSIWLCFFADKWGIVLKPITLKVIIGGVLIFALVCFLCSYVSIENIKVRDIHHSGYNNIVAIDIKSWKLFIFIGIELLTIFYTCSLKLRFLGGTFFTLFETMAKYRESVLFFDADRIVLPKWLSLLNSGVISSGYWFGYVLVNNYVINRRISVLPLIIFIISLINTLLTTARGGFFGYIIATIVYYLILNKIYFNNKISIKIFTLVKIVFLMIIFVISFQSLGSLVGRVSTSSNIDYLAKYCGAEIANLNIFLSKTLPHSELWGGQTFIYILGWICPKIGFTNISYKLDLPFVYHNGYSLGNVYTTFYSFIYDFGYKGVFYLTALMAFISQVVYKKTKIRNYDYKPSKCILIYGIIIYTLVFSFFSNKFYETIFNSGFIYICLFWFVFDYLLCDKSKKMFRLRAWG